MWGWLPGESMPLWGNVIYFGVAAVGVWLAGAKLSGYVDAIADRTGLGRVFAGALLLGTATSLPEIATTITAASRGMGTIAASNLLGGISMQIAVLAVADVLVMRGRALTFFAPTAAILMQGVVLIGLLSGCIAAIATGEVVSLAHVGLWPIGLFVAFLIALYVLYRYEQALRWEPTTKITAEDSPQNAAKLNASSLAHTSNGELAVRFTSACLAVLVSGATVAVAGEALAKQVGISQGFVGAVLIAVATSLPEISTTMSAIRLGAYSMAVGNILGTNSLCIALFLPGDLAFFEGPIVNQLGSSAIFLATLGILTTCIYMWGMLERRDRTVLGMGIDSALVLTVYMAGIVLYSSM